MDIKEIPKKFKKYFLKFWRSDNSKVSLVRDVVIALTLVLIILTSLWAYTGQWFGTPMVAIESGSMMHDNEPYGRLGTIDAGDMVLLVKVDSKDDIVPHGGNRSGPALHKDQDYYFYWDYGDVIVYHPYGSDSLDPIIHRVRCWVEYHEEYGTYSVRDYGLYNVSSVVIPELGLTEKYKYRPPHSGFITKGDNNDACDQLYKQLCNEPIKVEWISGKARQELPWIGTINLFFNDLTSDGEDTVPNVPSDSITCLIILIASLVSIPIILDIIDYINNRKKPEDKKESKKKETQENPKEENRLP